MLVKGATGSLNYQIDASTAWLQNMKYIQSFQANYAFLCLGLLIVSFTVCNIIKFSMYEIIGCLELISLWPDISDTKRVCFLLDSIDSSSMVFFILKSSSY